MDFVHSLILNVLYRQYVAEKWRFLFVNFPGSTDCECTVNIFENEEGKNRLHIYVHRGLLRRDLYVLLRHLILNSAILNTET